MSGSLLFHLFVLAIPGYFVWASFGYPPTARYIPLIIGVPVLLLQLWVIVRALAAPRAEAGDEPALSAQEGRRALTIILWMAAFFVLFCFLGAYPAVFIFVLMCLVLSSGTSWRLALAIAAGMAATLWLLFGLIMRYPLYEGALFGGLIPPL